MSDRAETLRNAAANGIVDDIVADLCARKGLRHEWDQIGADIRDEIREEWRQIVIRELKQGVYP